MFKILFGVFRFLVTLLVLSFMVCWLLVSLGWMSWPALLR